MSDPPPLGRAIADEFRGVETTVCLSTKVIVITEDRLELRIGDGLQKISAHDSWVAPLGVLSTCLATLLTADFKTFSWIGTGTLKGLFIAATFASFLWLLMCLRRRTKFGRREFIESIRSAGSQYFSQNAMTGGVSVSGDVTALLTKAARDQATVTNIVQCRQCGKPLPEPVQDEVTRCPNCGTLA
jgi:hypothetical protein